MFDIRSFKFEAEKLYVSTTLTPLSHRLLAKGSRRRGTEDEVAQRLPRGQETAGYRAIQPSLRWQDRGAGRAETAFQWNGGNFRQRKEGFTGDKEILP